MWKVIIDISPEIIKGTNGCHKYVFNTYKTKKEANKTAEEINKNKTMGYAFICK